MVETGLLCLPRLQHPLAVILTMTYEPNDQGNPPRATSRSSLVKFNRRLDSCKQQIWHANLTESASWRTSVPGFATCPFATETVLPNDEFNGRGISGNRNRGGTSETVSGV
jgi:hypothetical protein